MNKRGKIRTGLLVIIILILTMITFQSKSVITLQTNSSLDSDNSYIPKVGGGGGMRLPGQAVSPPLIRQTTEAKNLTVETPINQSEKIKQVPQVNINRYIYPTIKEKLKNQSCAEVIVNYRKEYNLKMSRLCVNPTP